MKRLRVLILDDEHKIGLLISRLIHFSELPLELIGVMDDSEAAIVRIAEEKPDIVICDIQMPVIDGLGVIERTQNMGLDPKFIMVSGYRKFEYAHQALKYGVEDYLLKPVNEDELNRVLANICDLHNEQLERQKETQELKETAAREHMLSARDALETIESGTYSADMEEMNRQFHIALQDGRFLAFILHLDVEETEEEIVETENRLLLGNLLELTEKKLKPVVFEQLYLVKDSRTAIGLINYADHKDADIVKELQTVFIELNRHAGMFEGRYLTMAVGDPGDYSAMDVIMASAQERIRQRIISGAGCCISDTEWASAGGRQLGQETASKIRNAVISMNSAALKEVIDEVFRQYENCEGRDSSRIFAAAEELNDLFRASLEEENRSESEQLKISEKLENCRSVKMIRSMLGEQFGSLLNEIQKNKEVQARRPVRFAMEYVAEHYAEKVTLEDICNLLQMNTSYFSSLFKKETGENFQNYLTEFRLEKAKELLRDTTDTMASIAYQVGYTDTRYFSQTFAKVTGMKPSLYRKMYS